MLTFESKRSVDLNENSKYKKRHGALNENSESMRLGDLEENNETKAPSCREKNANTRSTSGW